MNRFCRYEKIAQPPAAGGTPILPFPTRGKGRRESVRRYMGTASRKFIHVQRRPNGMLEKEERSFFMDLRWGLV